MIEYMVKVKNAKGTGDTPCPSGYKSWLDYWKKQTGNIALACGASDCKSLMSDGAHVQKVNSTDKCMYIIPLCKKCNQREDEFDVDEKKLVPVPSNLSKQLRPRKG
jgi:hypothetical protein